MVLFTEYRHYDGLGLAELVRNKEVTREELVETAIRHIERHDAKVNAVVIKQFDSARRRAARTEGRSDGLFDGVPFLNKDLGFEEAGELCTNGSRAYRNYRPDQDSEAVKRYRRSGLIFCGRASSPESGLCSTTEPVLYGPCRNPWDTSRTPGGSSGGSAAAVAAGMVPAASASDGGGSIRIPASCCGLFGMKPTRFRVSTAPQSGDPWNGLSAKHAVTRSVRDSAALLDIVAGYVSGDPYAAPAPQRPYLEEVSTEPGRLRIGVSARPLYDQPVSADCLAALHDAARLCEDLGHDVQEASPEYDREIMREGWFAIVAANEVADARDLAALLGREPGEEDLEPWTRRVIEIGRSLSGERLIAAIRGIQRESRKIAAFYENYDLMLNPTLAKPPVPVGEVNMSFADEEVFMQRATGFSPFTRLANCTGQPSMSVPLYWNAEGLPIGVMFTGRFGDEATLYRMAGQLERARPWADKRPPGFD